MEINYCSLVKTLTYTFDDAEKLQPLGDADRSEMLSMKEEDCKTSGEEFDGKINMWDLR